MDRRKLGASLAVVGITLWPGLRPRRRPSASATR